MVCQDCSASSRLYTYNLPASDDIQNRLRTDFNPSDASQLSEIKEMIRCAEDDLKAYRAEILHLKSKVMVLSTKSDLLEKHTTKIRSLLSPVRRLPNEVLGHIFSYCCDTVFPVDDFSWRDRNAFLSVCSRWREVGLTTPQIWSVIYLASDPVGIRQIGSFPRVEAALGRHIELSRACSLDITIGGPDRDTVDQKLLEMLARCSNRWKRLRLEVTGDEFFALPDLPILEMLHVEKSSVCPETAIKMQSLRHCTVPVLSPGDATTSVPWGNITSLKLDVDEPIDYDNPLFGVVEQCTNLVTLEYQNVHPLSDYREELQPFIIPQISRSVKNLKFSFTGGRDVPGSTTLDLLLDSLTFPSLESLSLVASEFSRRHLDVNNCRLFIDRSACSITSFTLQDFAMSDKELLSLLTVLPALTDLNVHERRRCDVCDATITETFSQGLHGNPNPFQSPAQPLLPRLQRLSIKVNGGWFVENVFVEMLMSRWSLEGLNFNLGTSVPGTSSGSSSGSQATFPVQCLQRVKVHVMERRVDRVIWKQLDCLGIWVLLIDEDPPSCKVVHQPMVKRKLKL